MFFCNIFLLNLFVILLDKIQLSSIGIVLHKVILSNIDRDTVVSNFFCKADDLSVYKITIKSLRMAEQIYECAICYISISLYRYKRCCL